MKATPPSRPDPRPRCCAFHGLKRCAYHVKAGSSYCHRHDKMMESERQAVSENPGPFVTSWRGA